MKWERILNYIIEYSLQCWGKVCSVDRWGFSTVFLEMELCICVYPLRSKEFKQVFDFFLASPDHGLLNVYECLV